MTVEAPRKIADNVALILIARFMMVVFGPVTLAAVIWVASSIRSTERMIDKHELRIELSERELRLIREARVGELQALQASLANITARLSQIDINIAVVTQQQKDSDRRLDELRSYLEGRLGIKPPR